MFDLGDFVVGNVRIKRELRRWRNGSRSRDARHRGNVGHHGNVDNVNVVGNIVIVRNVDDLRNAGHDGVVGNVRLRLEQYCFIVDSNVNVAHNAGWRRSNRNSVGIYRDWQSWGWFRSSGADARRITHCWCRRDFAHDTHRYTSVHDCNRGWECFREHSSREKSERININSDGSGLMTKEPSRTTATIGTSITPGGF